MTGEGVSKEFKSNEISLKDLIFKIGDWFQYLVSKWLIIFAFCILGSVGGVLYSYFKKPIYVASTTFVLESGESGGNGLGQYAGLASMVGIDIGGGGSIFQGDNIIELYKSRTMIEKTLLSEFEYNEKKDLLIYRYIDVNELRKKWEDKPELRNIRFYSYRGRQNQILNRLQDSIISSIVLDINKYYLNVAKPDKKLSIVRVDVMAKDEVFAKVFNDQLVENVNDFYIQTKTKKSLENVSILKQKADSVRSVMNGAIYSAAVIADETPNINPTRQVQRSAPMQRSQFNAETNKAILGELVKNLEMAKMALLKETPLIQVIDKPVYPLERIKVGKLKGLIVGSFVFGLLAVFALLMKKIFKEVLK